MIFDAAIAGAGPAGSFAACLLAGQGLKVALFDKARFPRDKVCGGGLSRKTLDLLGFDLSPVIHRRITGAFITYRNRATIVKDMDLLAGCTVLRCEFDDFLLQQAMARGASFFPETAFVDARQQGDCVRIDTSRGEIRSAYLIAADGVGSTVRSRLFGRRAVSYAPALEALVHVPDEGLEKFHGRVLFDLGGMPRGYGWIFPKRDHLNVGVYSVFGSQRLRACLDEFVARYPALSRHRQIRYQGYAIPLRNEAGVFEQGRVWLIGDAAGFAESVFGEGIYFALKSAQIAALAFAAAGGRPREGEYTKRVRRELLPELRYSERIGRALFSHAEFGFQRIARSAHANGYFAGLITGRVGYRECFYKTLVSAPYWLLSRREAPVAGALA